MSQTADQRRRIAAGLSARMTRDAEHRRCPNCQRKSALGPFVFDELTRCGSRTCRYCGYVRSTDPKLNGTIR